MDEGFFSPCVHRLLMNMNRLALYFLAVLLMWKMLHKHSACQDKKLLLGEPGTALVDV